MKRTNETREDFYEWLNSDNVIKIKGGYKTQCTQYTKIFTLVQVYKYFINEYINF